MEVNTNRTTFKAKS